MIIAILTVFYKCVETIMLFCVELFLGIINFIFVLIQTMITNALKKE
jgi:hypothetical protein